MKYRLLKDSHIVKAGAIFRQACRTYGSVYQHVLNEGTKDAYILEYIPLEVENNPTWFSPVDERYRPEDGDDYWTVTNDYPNAWFIKKVIYKANCGDDFLYREGLMFRKAEQALEAAKRIKQTLLDYYKELDK